MPCLPSVARVIEGPWKQTCAQCQWAVNSLEYLQLLWLHDLGLESQNMLKLGASGWYEMRSSAYWGVEITPFFGYMNSKYIKQ